MTKPPLSGSPGDLGPGRGRRLVPRQQIAASSALVARADASDQPGPMTGRIDPATVGVVSAPLELGGGEPGEASVVSERPGRVRVSTRSDTRQLLILSESFHEGWKLTVDGREEPIVRVYGDFLGGVVGPGRHELAFDFRPTSLRIGLAISAAGLVLLVILMLVPLTNRAPGNET